MIDEPHALRNFTIAFFSLSISVWRHCRISLDKHLGIFHESIKPYKDALKESGFSEALNYIALTTNKKNRKKKAENNMA